MIELDICKKNLYSHGEKKIKYYLTLARRQRLDFEKICQLISERTTLNAYEVEFVLSVLQDVAIENLQLGRGVNLEELGVFSPNFKTRVSMIWRR
jgi:predicted histone-like DNA-binding protein